MRHLEYKGWKSTRLRLGVLAALGVTAAYIWGDVSAAQWLDFLKWDLGMFLFSEIGSKAAVAYREKGDAADT